MIRFGGPVYEKDLDKLIKMHKEKGYKATCCPNIDINDDTRIKDVREAFAKNDIMIAETSYWDNMMDTDLEARKLHREKTLEAMYLAEAVGARCAINIWGSYCHGNGNSKFVKENFSEDAFAEAVDIARYMIDTVKPKHAYFAYEVFPFNIVRNVDTLERLVKAVDRKQFGVHFDLANLVYDVDTYFNINGIVDDMMSRLGEHIVSCHVKDIKLKEPALTVTLDEVVAGQGNIDYQHFFTAINKLDRDTPMMLEHLQYPDEYDIAAAHIRKEVAKVGINI